MRATPSAWTGSPIRIADARVCAPVAPPRRRRSRRRGRARASAWRVGGRVAAAAVGDDERVGRAAELLDDLEDGGLLALAPVRVERVDERVRAAVGELRAASSASSKLPRTSSTRAPSSAGLRELRAGDGALGHEHDRRDAGARGVRGGGRGGVAGRGADDRLARPPRPPSRRRPSCRGPCSEPVGFDASHFSHSSTP